MTREILDQAASWSLKALASPTPPTVPNFLAVIWRESKDGMVYITRIPSRKLGHFHPQELETFPCTRIPRSHFQPAWSSLITRFDNYFMNPGPVFIKQPRLVGYDETAGIAEKVRQEISVLEALHRIPHPNIAQYHGCLVDEKRGHVTGICMKKYPCTLAALLENHVPKNQQPPFNFNLILNGIFAGITHMHSLGLAHNDITPSNIMLDENGCAVIIDFNNSGPLGVPCRSGTPGWTNFSRVSAVENDLYGYDCVQQYMHTKVMQAAQRYQTAQAANASANPGLGSPVPDLQTQPAVPATASMFAQAPPVVPSGYQWSALNAMVPVVPGVN